MGIFNKLNSTSSKSLNVSTSSSSSPPPPYSNSNLNSFQVNEDNRPLPYGWVKQWDSRYQRNFFVNTLAQGGPQSHWIHPIDQQNQQQETSNNNNNNNNLLQRFNSSRPLPPPINPSQNYYQPNHQPQPNYEPQPIIYQPPPQRIQSNHTRRSGFNPLLAGAGGLAGGMLLSSLFNGHHHHHHHDYDYDDGYWQGYENGYDNGYDSGFEWGDMSGGGGDFF